MTLPLNNDSLPVEQQQTNLAVNGDAASMNGLEEKTPEYFKLAAMKKIEELRAPRKAIIELQSSLELLMQRYEFDKSYLDKAAEWYAKSAWWYEKAGILLLLSSSSTVVGLTIGVAMAPVFALLAIGIYFASTFLLMEHYNTTTRRDNRVREHFSNREAAMTDAIALLESAEQQVESIIIALCELNIKSADKLHSFEEQISLLKRQTTNYLATAQKLEQATESIVRDNEIIATHLKAANIELKKSQPDMDKQPPVLSSVINTLNENNAALSETNDDFVGVSKKMQANVTALTQLVVGFQEQLAGLKKHVEENDQTSVKLQASVNETLDTNINIDNLMTESDHAILNAASALDAFDKYMAGFDITENSPVNNNVPVRLVRTPLLVDVVEVNSFSMYGQ